MLLCLVCLFDLACFFLSSFSSLIKNMYMRHVPKVAAICTCTCGCSVVCIIHYRNSSYMYIHVLYMIVIDMYIVRVCCLGNSDDKMVSSSQMSGDSEDSEEHQQMD